MSLKRILRLLFVLFLIGFLASCAQLGPSEDAAKPNNLGVSVDLLADEEISDEDHEVYDPLEGWNRFWFGFNDVTHRYVFKPVSQVIDFVIPDEIQDCIENGFSNLYTPVRVVSNVLQGDWYDAGNEIQRFGLNSTIGVFGLVDVAELEFGITVSDKEDVGQVLGKWGAGEGFYIVWPFLGPSNVRDSVGLVGNAFLNPLTYLTDTESLVLIRAGEHTNSQWMRKDQYEEMLKGSMDPYIFIRDAYTQNRNYRIKK